MDTKRKLAVILFIAVIAIAVAYFVYTEKEDSVKPCFAMKDAANRDDCIVGKAIELNDASLCQKYLKKDSVYMDTCLSEIAVKAGDVTLCEGIKGNKTRGFCVFSIATAQTVPEMCNIDYSDNWQSLCYYNVSLTRLDPDLCENIKSHDIRDTCHFDMAILTKDENECNYVRNINSTNLCFVTMAVEKKDGDICRLIIRNPVKQDICLQKVAISSGNESACNRISYDIIKRDCLNITRSR